MPVTAFRYDPPLGLAPEIKDVARLPSLVAPAPARRSDQDVLTAAC